MNAFIMFMLLLSGALVFALGAIVGIAVTKLAIEEDEEDDDE
jgi:Na+-translocating ferredoxin:NAD+ oxidoreductase RNF subunit RnfB